jgi:DNA-damage-inducible protein D
MEPKDKLIVFEDKKIRRIWYNDEWYFSIVDIIAVLTESDNPRNYWSMLKKRELEADIELSTNCVQLKLEAPDGKLRETDCANTKSLFRIIQSKLWQSLIKGDKFRLKAQAYKILFI